MFLVQMLIVTGMLLLVYYSLKRIFEKREVERRWQEVEREEAGHRQEEERVKRLVADRVDESLGGVIDNRKRAVDYVWRILAPVHAALGREALVVVYLDIVNSIVHIDVRFGNATSVSFPPEEILHSAIKRHAAKVVLGHNHPGNYTTPSDNDVYHCVALYEMLSANGIQLLEDLVVCGPQLKSTLNTHRFKQMLKGY